MDNIKLDFLSKDNLIGDNKLDIFKKIVKRAQLTDFAVLCGASTGINDDNNLYYGYYYTKTPSSYEMYPYGVNLLGNIITCYSKSTIIGMRLVIDYANNEYLKKLIDSKDIVLFGNYPQKTISSDLEKILEEKYFKNELIKTNHTYTINSNKPPIDEYIYENKYYVRMRSMVDSESNGIKLSNLNYYVSCEHGWRFYQLNG